MLKRCFKSPKYPIRLSLCLSLAFVLLLFVPSLSAQDDSGTKVNELLKMSLEELMAVEISTAGKRPQKVSDIPASVVIITREDIKTFGYSSVEEILENVTGLYLIDDYIWTGTKNYGIRGYFSTGAFNDVIIMINGVSQKSDAMYNSYPTEKIAVPVGAIDRIEVIRGPMSVIYGSGAFFGAINIITTGYELEKPQVTVSTSVGANNLRKLYAQLQGRHGEFKYNFSGQYFSDDGIDVPFSKLMSADSIAILPVAEHGWNLQTTSTKGLLKTKRRYFNFAGEYKTFDFNLSLVNSNKNSVETIFGAGDGNMVYHNVATFSGGYQKEISPQLGVKGRFTYAFENHWVDNELFFKQGYTNNWARMSVSDYELNAYYTPSSVLKLTAGISTRWVDDFHVVADYPPFKFSDVEITIQEIVSHAFFIQSDFQLSNKINVTLGLRAENMQPYEIIVTQPQYSGTATYPLPPIYSSYSFKPVNKIELIPRMALLYNIDQNHVLKLLYGKAIKQPSANANLDLVFSRTTPLLPAEIQTFELNYSAAFSAAFYANVSIFHNDLNNLISRLNVLDPVQGLLIASSNAGKVSTNGAEVSINSYPTRNSSLDLSVTYQESQNKQVGFENIALGYSPKLLGYIRASHTIANNIVFSISGRYVGAMETAWSFENISEENLPVVPLGDPYKGRIGRKVDGLFTAGFNIRFDNILIDGMFLNLKLTNIFNAEIYYPTTISNPQFDKGTMGRGCFFLITTGIKI
ncbi:TonB-dependent receptor plug domain-containing protein [bacterium]|nr:TonB-dependent receptor plug domain-containing protein [bacterium]